HRRRPLAQLPKIDDRVPVAHRVGPGQTYPRRRQYIDAEHQPRPAERPEARVLSLQSHILREDPGTMDVVRIGDELVEHGAALVRGQGDIALRRHPLRAAGTRSEVLRIGQIEKRVPDRPPRPFAQAERWLIKFERWDKTALRGSVVDVRHAE